MPTDPLTIEQLDTIEAACASFDREVTMGELDRVFREEIPRIIGYCRQLLSQVAELEAENERLRKALERNTTPVSAQAGYVPASPRVMPPESVYDDDPYICQKCGCYKIHYRLKGLRCPRCD